MVHTGRMLHSLRNLASLTQLLPLPMVVLLQNGLGPVAIEPGLSGRIIAEIRVPKGGAQGENHAVVIGVALLGIAGQRPIAARKLKYFQDREFAGMFDPA